MSNKQSEVNTKIIKKLIALAKKRNQIISKGKLKNKQNLQIQKLAKLNIHQLSCQINGEKNISISEKDWLQIKSKFSTSLILWASNMVKAINFVENKLTKTSSSGNGFLVKLTIELGTLYIGGPMTSILKKTYTQYGQAIAKEIINGTTDANHSNANDKTREKVEVFCRKWRTALQNFAKNATLHEKIIFPHFKQALIANCSSKKTTLSLNAALREVTYLNKRLPSADVLKMALMIAWVKSSKDGLDWDNGKAGVFKVTIQLLQNKWKIHEAYIDDASRGKDTADAMKLIFGINTPLEEIPLDLYLTIVNPLSSSGKICKAEKKGSNTLAFKSGNELLFNSWKKAGIIPKTKDLKAE